MYIFLLIMLIYGILYIFFSALLNILQVNTLSNAPSAEFWRHYVLSGGTQRCASTPERRNENIKYLIRGQLWRRGIFNASGCGFATHSRNWNIYLYLYFDCAGYRVKLIVIRFLFNYVEWESNPQPVTLTVTGLCLCWVAFKCKKMNGSYIKKKFY